MAFPKAVKLPIAPSNSRFPVPRINIRPPGPSSVESNVMLPVEAPPDTFRMNVPDATVVGFENVKLAPGAAIFESMREDPLMLIVLA